MKTSTPELAFSFPDGINAFPTDDDSRTSALSRVSLFGPEYDAEREAIRNRIFKSEFSEEEDRAFGAFIGLVIGDALGAPLEFSPLRYGEREIVGFSPEPWEKPGYNAFGLQPGQWTDDASMALCLADSLLLNGGFNGHDIRLRFLNWWRLGYCNAFGYDNRRRDKRSVGRGGNVSESFDEFVADKTEFTTAGDLWSSGNGTLMRNAPVAVFARHDQTQAQTLAWKQSKTTHQGDEAAECCRLLTHCILNGIFGDGTNNSLGSLGEGFSTDLYSVTCLSKSRREERTEGNQNQNLQDRDWDWRNAEFRFAPSRAEAHPGYIGSYAMDALSMALHCAWITDSFQEAMIKSANLRGDSDTVGAVTGQIAGAIYGISAIPSDWLEAILRWDPHANLLLRAQALFEARRLKPAYHFG